MKIALIAMSGVRVKTAELAALGVTLPGFVRRGEVIASLPSLGLLNVAGLTPPYHEVTYHEIAHLPEPGALPDADLVAISSFTAQIEESYRIAGRYRSQGIPVVMGGLHASMMPHEALEYADAVVTGGAEEAWPRLLEDLGAGRLGRIYQGARDGVFEQGRYVRPRFDLLAGRPYNRVTVQTSRGCPRRCDFCAASLRITSRFNQKPVDQVLAEIREARRHVEQPFFEFADDNTFLDKAWSKQLLRRLAGEGIRYFTETDASVADDPELCDLLADSGCRQLLIGFESPNGEDLHGIDPAGWKMRQAGRLGRVVDTLQSRGISVNGCFILGLDNHTPDVFPSTLDFVRSSGLAEVQYTVLTPFPGTPLFERMRREGRLLADRFWDRCTLFDVNYRPLRMTVEELERGLAWLMKETYSAEATSARVRGFVEQRRLGRVTAPPGGDRASRTAPRDPLPRLIA